MEIESLALSCQEWIGRKVAVGHWKDKMFLKKLEYAGSGCNGSEQSSFEISSSTNRGEYA